MAAATNPAATAAALPPDEPPGVCALDHGLRVCPNPGPLVNGHCPSSQVLVLPTMTAPAARSRRTTSYVSVGTEPGGHTGDVDVVFDGDRNSQQRKFLARRAFAVGLGRVGQCLFA
jgi:hypothetical protein